MTPTIKPNGRISGTRISVYDIVPYLESGKFTHEQIAHWNGISMEELQVALKYIEENHEDVKRVNRAIDERNDRGNPPEIQARLDRFSARFKKFRLWLAEQRPHGSTQNGDDLHANGDVLQTFRQWMIREDEREKEGKNN